MTGSPSHKTTCCDKSFIKTLSKEKLFKFKQSASGLEKSPLNTNKPPFSSQISANCGDLNCSRNPQPNILSITFKNNKFGVAQYVSNDLSQKYNKIHPKVSEFYKSPRNNSSISVDDKTNYSQSPENNNSGSIIDINSSFTIYYDTINLNNINLSNNNLILLTNVPKDIEMDIKYKIEMNYRENKDLIERSSQSGSKYSRYSNKSGIKRDKDQTKIKLMKLKPLRTFTLLKRRICNLIEKEDVQNTLTALHGIVQHLQMDVDLNCSRKSSSLSLDLSKSESLNILEKKNCESLNLLEKENHLKITQNEQKLSQNNKLMSKTKKSEQNSNIKSINKPIPLLKYNNINLYISYNNTFVSSLSEKYLKRTHPNRLISINKPNNKQDENLKCDKSDELNYLIRKYLANNSKYIKILNGLKIIKYLISSKNRFLSDMLSREILGRTEILDTSEMCSMSETYLNYTQDRSGNISENSTAISTNTSKINSCEENLSQKTDLSNSNTFKSKDTQNINQFLNNLIAKFGIFDKSGKYVIKRGINQKLDNLRRIIKEIDGIELNFGDNLGFGKITATLRCIEHIGWVIESKHQLQIGRLVYIDGSSNKNTKNIQFKSKKCYIMERKYKNTKFESRKCYDRDKNTNLSFYYYKSDLTDKLDEKLSDVHSEHKRIEKRLLEDLQKHECVFKWCNKIVDEIIKKNYRENTKKDSNNKENNTSCDINEIYFGKEISLDELLNLYREEPNIFENVFSKNAEQDENCEKSIKLQRNRHKSSKTIAKKKFIITKVQKHEISSLCDKLMNSKSIDGLFIMSDGWARYSSNCFDSDERKIRKNKSRKSKELKKNFKKDSKNKNKELLLDQIVQLKSLFTFIRHSVRNTKEESKNEQRKQIVLILQNSLSCGTIWDSSLLESILRDKIVQQSICRVVVVM